MSFIVALGIRVLLCILFFPFSACDKIFGFKGAVAQAQEQISNHSLASLLILIGICVEILMPLGIITGTADRLAGFIMAGYCCVTALLWKQFWATGDFWAGSNSKGRGLFWDFLKNFSLAGGFLLVTFGTSSLSVPAFLHAPFASSHPYTQSQP